MAADEVSPRAYAPILSSGTVNMPVLFESKAELFIWLQTLQVQAKTQSGF